MPKKKRKKGSSSGSDCTEQESKVKQLRHCGEGNSKSN